MQRPLGLFDCTPTPDLPPQPPREALQRFEGALTADGAQLRKAREGARLLAGLAAEYVWRARKPRATPAKVKQSLTDVARAAAELKAALARLPAEAQAHLLIQLPSDHLDELFSHGWRYPTHPREQFQAMQECLPLLAPAVKVVADRYEAKTGRARNDLAAYLFEAAALTWRAACGHLPPLTKDNETAARRPGRNSRRGGVVSPLLDAMRDVISDMHPGAQTAVTPTAYQHGVKSARKRIEAGDYAAIGLTSAPARRRGRRPKARN